MGDDPLIPPNTTADGQTFRDWVDFVDRVARPLVEDDADWDGELGDLYRKASPYFICVALLMAYNRAYPQLSEEEEMQELVTTGVIFPDGTVVDALTVGEPEPAALVDAHGRLIWVPPTRFDPDDRDTWPEDGQRVLVWWADEWTTIGFVLDDGTPAWVDVDGAVDEVTPGNLWLPLPPTPEVQG